MIILLGFELMSKLFDNWKRKVSIITHPYNFHKTCTKFYGIPGARSGMAEIKFKEEMKGL